jgi:hypothetical protein
MKTIIPLAFLAGVAALSACTSAQVATTIQANPQIATAVAAVCQIDGQAQPIVVLLATPIVTVVAPTYAVAVAGAIDVDKSTVHPAIVAACAAVKGVADAVVPTAPPATETAATATTAPLPAAVVPTAPAAAPVAAAPVAVAPTAAVAK